MTDFSAGVLFWHLVEAIADLAIYERYFPQKSEAVFRMEHFSRNVPRGTFRQIATDLIECSTRNTVRKSALGWRNLDQSGGGPSRG